MVAVLVVHEKEVDQEEVGKQEGVCVRVVWCVALLMAASFGGQSWRPEVAVQREEEEEEEGSESVEYEEEAGCLGWTLHL